MCTIELPNWARNIQLDMCSRSSDGNICIDTQVNSPPKPWTPNLERANVPCLAALLLLSFRCSCEAIFTCEVNVLLTPPEHFSSPYGCLAALRGGATESSDESMAHYTQVQLSV